MCWRVWRAEVRSRAVQAKRPISVSCGRTVLDDVSGKELFQTLLQITNNGVQVGRPDLRHQDATLRARPRVGSRKKVPDIRGSSHRPRSGQSNILVNSAQMDLCNVIAEVAAEAPPA